MRQGLVFLCDRYPRGRNLAGVDLLIWADIRTKNFGLEDPGVVSPAWIFSGRDNYHGGINIYIILIEVEMESHGARPRTGILRLKGSSAPRLHHHYFHFHYHHRFIMIM